MSNRLGLRGQKLLVGAASGGIVRGGVVAAFVYVFLHAREGRGGSDTHGARVVSFVYASRDLDGEVDELGVIPRGGRPAAAPHSPPSCRAAFRGGGTSSPTRSSPR